MLVHTTAANEEIYVEPGSKSRFDLRVRYKIPGRRLRTPAHVHLIVELYVKLAHDGPLTLLLRDHLLRIYRQVRPAEGFPPPIPQPSKASLARFRRLNEVGEFTVEFLVLVSQLMFIQEKTNYPQGSLTEELYKAFGSKDRFSVIQKAIYRGKRR